MKLLRFRYLSALCVNFALPWLAYRLALPHWGQLGALEASAVPLVAWMVLDLWRFKHFDALSALVLIGVVLSIAALLLGGGPRTLALEEPFVSGMIGLSILVSLILPRPMLYYLARSTMARESDDGAAVFEAHWRNRPELAHVIRTMSIVWGVGLSGENLARYLIAWHWGNGPRVSLMSDLFGYGVYAMLTLWTFLRRKRIRQDASIYDDKAGSVAR